MNKGCVTGISWCTQSIIFFFFFQAKDGIRDYKVTGVQTCALPICMKAEDTEPLVLFRQFFGIGVEKRAAVQRAPLHALEDESQVFQPRVLGRILRPPSLVDVTAEEKMPTRPEGLPFIAEVIRQPAQIALRNGWEKENVSGCRPQSLQHAPHIAAESSCLAPFGKLAAD